ncbi:hypothetical protein Zmor_024769 [Zophobas morio]|uniref:Uncharacterized protein n=1 Tax=Zophobas morio TaxID=2755281 RepID=A0AA38M8B5_9CUCU|nr:hypothetical protein Zmor_024769 [Zophobas morio]
MGIRKEMQELEKGSNNKNGLMKKVIQLDNNRWEIIIVYSKKMEETNIRQTVLSSKTNDDVDMECRKCKNKVSNAWSCVKCHTYFHKSYALVVQERNNKLIFLSNNELVCDKCCGDSNESVSANSSTSPAQDVLKFLNSDEFSNLLNKMVDKAVSPLMIEIKKLKR